MELIFHNKTKHLGVINEKLNIYRLSTISHRRQTYHINLVDQTHIQRTRPRRKTVFFKTSLRVYDNSLSSLTNNLLHIWKLIH